MKRSFPLHVSLCAFGVFIVGSSAREAASRLFGARDLLTEAPFSDPIGDRSSPQNAKMKRIKHVTFHATVTETGNGSIAREVELIKTLRVAKHGGVPYHFILGNSGKVYRTRSLDLVPASNTFYFPREGTGAPSGFEPETGKVASNEVWAYYMKLINAEFERWKRTNPSDFKIWSQQPDVVKAFGSGDAKAIGSVKRALILPRIAPGHSDGHATIGFLGGLGDLPDRKALNAAARLAAEILHEEGLGVDDVRAHYETAYTACPGKQIYDWLWRSPRPNGTGTIRPDSSYGEGAWTISYYLKELQNAEVTAEQ